MVDFANGVVLANGVSVSLPRNPNNWSVSATDPIVAWTLTGNPTLTAFAIPANS